MMGDPFKNLKPLKFGDEVQIGEVLNNHSQLTSLPLDRLVIDERYQRKVRAGGKRNIRLILESFDWRKFIPVVVTRVEGGFFAIIDGQHRATAALMHPDIDIVPCMVIDASVKEAAECFSAINGKVSAVSRVELFRARVAAEDPVAMELLDILEIAGVKLVNGKSGYGVPWRVGDTYAIASIEKVFKNKGRDILITALMAIVESGDGNAGNLSKGIIYAVAEALSSCPAALEGGEALFVLMDEIDLDDAYFQASKQVKFGGGASPGGSLQKK